MSLALMAFNGWNGGANSATPAAGPNSAPSDASAADQATADPQSQVLADMQSLLATLTGTTGSASTDTSDTAAAMTGMQTAPGSTMAQNLQTDLGTLASTSGTAQPGGADGHVAGAPPWSDDISNAGTTTPDGPDSGWKPGYSDDFQQQFAVSAYSASATSGLDSSATSALADLKV